MIHRFEDNVSILINSNKLDSEFHLYEVGYEKCRPTKPFEYIPINYWVLHYCMEGEGYFSTPSVPKQKITAGDIFLIPANSRNMYYPNPDNPWTYRWVGFSGEAANLYMEKIGFNQTNCILKGSIDVKMSTLFEMIYLDFKQNNLFAALSKTFSLFECLTKKITRRFLKMLVRNFLKIFLYILMRISLLIYKLMRLHVSITLIELIYLNYLLNTTRGVPVLIFKN